MIKNDYVILAKVIHTARSINTEKTGEAVAVAYLLAEELERENPHFNRELFFTACGVAV